MITANARKGEIITGHTSSLKGFKMKKYKLQKELPELKAGAVFEYDDINDNYVCETKPDKPGEETFYFKSKYVENKPEWFLPVESATFGTWIPVSERNPIEMNEYLVTFEKGPLQVVQINRFNTEWWYAGTIAWMPLPKPYHP